MVRKLEDGHYLLERDRAVAPVNRIRPVDIAAAKRHDGNKKALFRKA